MCPSHLPFWGRQADGGLSVAPSPGPWRCALLHHYGGELRMFPVGSVSNWAAPRQRQFSCVKHPKTHVNPFLALRGRGRRFFTPKSPLQFRNDRLIEKKCPEFWRMVSLKNGNSLYCSTPRLSMVMVLGKYSLHGAYGGRTDTVCHDWHASCKRRCR